MFQERWLLRIGFQLRTVALPLPVRCVACFSSLAHSLSRGVAFLRLFVLFCFCGALFVGFALYY
jgi:hypothetical protein